MLTLFIILASLTMTLFSEKVLISNRCISGLMPNLIKKILVGLWYEVASIYFAKQMWKCIGKSFVAFLVLEIFTWLCQVNGDLLQAGNKLMCSTAEYSITLKVRTRDRPFTTSAKRLGVCGIRKNGKLCWRSVLFMLT